MDVELPSGCNIINSSTSFYNYTNSNRTRTLYYIVDGKAFVSSSNTASTPYTYTGTCLTTGDLVYKPELEVFFTLGAIALCSLIAVLLWKTIGRLIGR